MQVQFTAPIIQDETFNQLLKQVNETNTGVVVKGAGNMDGVLITTSEYAQIQRRKQEAFDELSTLVGEMRANVAQSGLTAAEIQARIDQAVQEVRAENQNRSSQRSHL